MEVIRMTGLDMLLIQWFLDLVWVSSYWRASKTLSGVYRFKLLKCIFVCGHMCVIIAEHAAYM